MLTQNMAVLRGYYRIYSLRHIAKTWSKRKSYIWLAYKTSSQYSASSSQY